MDADQSIDASIPVSNFDIGSDVRSVGVGLGIEFDTRDMPMNSYAGKQLKVDVLFNDEEMGSNRTYQNYSASYRSYHTLTDSMVLAWEIQGCKRGGTAPLWDARTVKLRGFSAPDYLGQTSASGQAEIR